MTARGWRRAVIVLRRVALAAYLSVAPSRVMPWRLDLREVPVAMLVVGEPTPALHVRRARD